MTSYRPGELRLAVMGDLLHDPGAEFHAVARRLEVADAAAVRIVLGRLESNGMVRKLNGGGFMLTRAGLEHLATVRRWVNE